ncbi:MAG: hypothetical protein PGN13_09845 [Patulibacter minatonensis]
MSAPQPAFPQPTGSAQTGEPALDDAPRGKAQRRRTSVAWPAPSPQAAPPTFAPAAAPPAPPAPQPVHAAPVVVPDPAPAGPPTALRARVAPQAPTAPQAPAAPQAPVLPRFMAPAPTPAAAPAPTPAAPHGARFVPPAPLPQAPPPPAAPALPAATPRTSGTSAAPPGFSGERLRVAESAQLLALDPSFDDDDGEPFAALASNVAPTPAAPVAATPSHVDPAMAAFAAPTHPFASPATAPQAPRADDAERSIVTKLLVRSGDRARFGRDRAATIRVATTILIASLLLVVAGPPLAKALKGVPVIGTALDQLRAFTLAPGAFGLPWLAGVLGIASIAGTITAHMEQQAEKQGMRRDPARRLNIGLATLLAITLGSGLFSTLHAHGWAASAASLGYFTGLCLLLPLGRLPGARAMATQPERSWALLCAASAIAMVLAPSLPTIALLLLSFTRVRTHWAAISAGDDTSEERVDATNRTSALVIVLGVLLASSFGMHVMQLSSSDVDAMRAADDIVVPGAVQGPTVDELHP